MRHVSLIVVLCLSLTVCANADTIALWNFNDADSSSPGVFEEFLVDRGNGGMATDFTASHIDCISGSSVNSRDGDPAGKALVLKNEASNGQGLTWLVDTTGFDSIHVSFATQRTSTGFSSNQFSYSIDTGLTWSSYGSPYTPNTSFSLQSFDLGAIEALNNNPAAGFRIIFDGATSSSGNNRIDNLVVSGNPFSRPTGQPVPEPSTAILVGLGLGGVLAVRGKRKCGTRTRQ